MQFIGMCETKNKKEFQVKLEALFIAMGWGLSNLVIISCYDNRIQDSFESLKVSC